jgi:putative transposase
MPRLRRTVNSHADMYGGTRASVPPRRKTTKLGAMSRYRRNFVPGGTYFFTVTLASPRSQALTEHIDIFRAAYRTVHSRSPFETVAICVLPNHFHAIWRLPDGDANYSGRLSRIKAGFSRGVPAAVERSKSKVGKREKGIWQRRFWEHTIRDDRDLETHVDYVHYNPVKHAWVNRVSDWPYSSFHRYVRLGLCPLDWAGSVAGTGDFGE